VSFTDEVKQELAGQAVDEDDAGLAELAALLRFGGALVLAGGDRGIDVDLETVSGATARRAYTLLQRHAPVVPELRVRAPGGVQRRRVYGVRIETVGDQVAREVGLIDDRGRHLPPPTLRGRAAVATLRGAFLAAGSISAPDRPPHLEIVAHRLDAAEALVATMADVTDGAALVAGGDRGRPRVVVKSGATIGELLAGLGATGAFLRWDERRLRRQVRGEATRLANADAANLRRTVEAASGQVAAVERVLRAVGWDGLDEDLRGVALARLVSPEASLTELGQLSDPPLSRSAVHRRLRRLEAIAADLDRDGAGS
jgi:cell division protein WhiA